MGHLQDNGTHAKAPSLQITKTLLTKKLPNEENIPGGSAITNGGREITISKRHSFTLTLYDSCAQYNSDLCESFCRFCFGTDNKV